MAEPRRLKPWAIAIFTTLAALLLLFGVRWGGVQFFRAPAGSMQPTVQVGDHFMVSKWSYGYSRYSLAPFQDLFGAGRVFARAPERGDIVVFRPEPEPTRDFVKRVIGMPGDRIQMIDGALYINGEAVQRESVGPTRECPDFARCRR